MKTYLCAVALFSALGLAGCEAGNEMDRQLNPENHKPAPIFVEADGQFYPVCAGYVDISTSSDGTYGVRFTDISGTSHDIRGVKHLHTSTMPKAEWRDYSFPSHLPDPKLERDGKGQSYQEGYQYTWPDGSKATLRNGRWEHVQYWYDPCKQSTN